MWQRRVEFQLLQPIAFVLRHGNPKMAVMEDQCPEWAEANRPRVLDGARLARRPPRGRARSSPARASASPTSPRWSRSTSSGRPASRCPRPARRLAAWRAEPRRRARRWRPERCPPPTRAADLAALAWQLELGADEAIGEAPVNRFDRAAAPRRRAAPPPAAVAAPLRRVGASRRRWRRPAAISAALRAAHGGLRGLRAEAGRAQPGLRRRRPARAGDDRSARRRGATRTWPGCPSSGARGSCSTGCWRRSGCRGGPSDPARGGLHHQRAALAAAAEPRPVGRRGGDAGAVPLPPHRAGRARRCWWCSARRRRARCSRPPTGSPGCAGAGRPGAASRCCHLPPGGAAARPAEEARGLGGPAGAAARLDGRRRWRRLTPAAPSCRCASRC